jgi:hypothetical protein
MAAAREQPPAPPGQNKKPSSRSGTVGPYPKLLLQDLVRLTVLSLLTQLAVLTGRIADLDRPEVQKVVYVLGITWQIGFVAVAAMTIGVIGKVFNITKHLKALLEELLEVLRQALPW